MRTPRWSSGTPRPLRWAAGGAVVLALAGIVWGLIESVRDYPASSWFGVTLYLCALGAAVGLVLGLVAYCLLMVINFVRRRTSAPSS